jgi:chromosome segregation ATPase
MEYEYSILKMEREFLRQQATNQQNIIEFQRQHIEQLIRQGDLLYKNIEELKNEKEALKKDCDLKNDEIKTLQKDYLVLLQNQTSKFFYLFVRFFISFSKFKIAQ